MKKFESKELMSFGGTNEGKEAEFKQYKKAIRQYLEGLFESNDEFVKIEKETPMEKWFSLPQHPFIKKFYLCIEDQEFMLPESRDKIAEIEDAERVTYSIHLHDCPEPCGIQFYEQVLDSKMIRAMKDHLTLSIIQRDMRDYEFDIYELGKIKMRTPKAKKMRYFKDSDAEFIHVTKPVEFTDVMDVPEVDRYFPDFIDTYCKNLSISDPEEFLYIQDIEHMDNICEDELLDYFEENPLDATVVCEFDPYLDKHTLDVMEELVDAMSNLAFDKCSWFNYGSQTCSVSMVNDVEPHLIRDGKCKVTYYYAFMSTFNRYNPEIFGYESDLKIFTNPK